jgi:hypothetical protein
MWPGSRRTNYRGDDPEAVEDDRIARLARKRMVSAELEDFLRYLHSPWHILWRNMFVGLARGLGAVFGATVVVGVALWLLAVFVDLPLVGSYFNDLRARVSAIAEEARYSDDFVRMQRTLRSIDERLQEQNELLRTLAEQQDQ